MANLRSPNRRTPLSVRNRHVEAHFKPCGGGVTIYAQNFLLTVCQTSRYANFRSKHLAYLHSFVLRLFADPMSTFCMAGSLPDDSLPRCTIVVPCYNEEQRLATAAFRAFLLDCPPGIRLLLVNDGSRDRTLDILNGLADEFPGAAVLNQSRNMGKAEAVRTGMLQAIAEGATITGFWDADLATPLSELPRLLAILQEHPTVAILLGSRVRLLGRSVSRKSMRHYSGRVFATLASLTLDLPVYDTQCGAKLFRVAPILSEALAQRFRSRWIFDVELLARYLVLRRSGNHAMPDPASFIYEEPLRSWHDVEGSKLKATDSFKALGELLEIRRRYFSI